MTTMESFKKITDDDVGELSRRWNFVPVSKYDTLMPPIAPTDGEIGLLVIVPYSAADAVIGSRPIDNYTIERLIISKKRVIKDNIDEGYGVERAEIWIEKTTCEVCGEERQCLLMDGSQYEFYNGAICQTCISAAFNAVEQST